MIVLKGVGVFKDIAFGMLSMSRKSSFLGMNKHIVKDVSKELERYFEAREKAIKEVRILYEKALKNLGAAEAEIFAVHEMMIKDVDYESTVSDIIKNKKFNAEYAVWEASRKFSQIFSNMGNFYMKQRASDVWDISQRIINLLSGVKEKTNSSVKKIILQTDDLTPSEVSSLDREMIKGIILSKGSDCSHAAIISKVLKIPAVVNVDKDFKSEYDGKQVIIDSFSGKIYIDPDEKTEKLLIRKKEEIDERNKLLKYLKGKDNVTLDGKRIDIYANLNNPEEIESVLENDAGGIGLFRSEFLYLNRDSCPSEDEQFEIYKNIIQKMGKKRVIIRTADIGSDKKVKYLGLPEEENPALGFRGIRVSFDKPDIFMTQLKAIYRASAFGNVSIMFPMIISSEEVDSIMKYVEMAKKELKNRNIEFSDNVPLGIMIETPAAAIISGELAEKVDFFSIGTNDLTQYTLAADRQNCKIGNLIDKHHKSILKLIKFVADNAHKTGISVGICGELAADESLTETFLSMGIDELSISPTLVLGLRKKIIETDLSKSSNSNNFII